MKKISDIVLKNLSLKLLSLLVAVVLWFVGMNIHDPAITRSFTVKLTLENKELITANKLYLLNETSLEGMSINFTIRGRRTQLEELRKLEKEMSAVVDLSPIDISNPKDIGVTRSATVNLKLPDSVIASNYERVNTYPSSVDIRLDLLVSETIPIEPIITGKASEGYVALTSAAEVFPQTVKVTGAKTTVDQIYSARVQLDLIDATENVVTSAKLKLYDSNNKEITNVTKDVGDVEISVPVRKYAKIPISTPLSLGTVADGYRITSVSVMPTHVEVIGTEEDINAISQITLQPVSFSDVSATQTRFYDLRAYLMDTKLSIKEGTPQEAIVTVVVEKEETLSIELAQDKIVLSGADEETIAMATEPVTITIKGLKEELKNIDANDIKATADISDLNKGLHIVPLEITLPDGVTIVSEYTAEIQIGIETDVEAESSATQ